MTPPASSRWAWPVLAVGVVGLALASRLIPLLRGGGLLGLGNYDDGVHYASAAGLVRGLLPYRDFLLLQPPGISVLLAPFALLGRVAGDPVGFAVARLAFVAVGSLTAALVARWLRPLGLMAAAVGGSFYALFLPAAYVDRSTLLEGPGNTLVIIALLLISRSHSRRSRQTLLLSLAGVALGLSVAIKIWAIVAVLIIVGWLWLVRSWRPALRVLVCAGATGAVIALPFLVLAPRPMWQMVVTDQLGRRRTGGLTGRLVNLTGLSRWDLTTDRTMPLVLTVAGLVVALVLAVTVVRARLPALLLVADAVILLMAPSAFLHYGALVAGPAALVVGAGTARLVAVTTVRTRTVGGRRIVAGALTALLLAGMAVWGSSGLADRWGRRFPAAALRPAAAAVHGCIATDDPGTLILLDVLDRDVADGCPFVIDLGGHSYHPPLLAPGARDRNQGWQRFALSYLRDADLVIIVRFRSNFGFDRQTAREVNRWPVVAESGRYRLRAPRPGGG
ncbi:MAG: glycosyltransferase 87 family protein [Propionibacteriaceae bacterium]